MTSLDLVRLLDEAARTHGPPKAISCDNSPEFRSRLLGDWIASIASTSSLDNPVNPRRTPSPRGSIDDYATNVSERIDSLALPTCSLCFASGSG